MELKPRNVLLQNNCALKGHHLATLFWLKVGPFCSLQEHTTIEIKHSSLLPGTGIAIWQVMKSYMFLFSPQTSK
jgi:hypothetical protein